MTRLQQLPTPPGEPLLRLLAPYARQKGMVAWQPSPGTLEWRCLQDIHAVLDQYRDHLPLGNRSIMYRLLPAWVPTNYRDKNALQKMVTATLTKARRAGLIPFESIDDQRTTWDGPFTSDQLPGLVGEMQTDRQVDQPHRIEVWVETKGNVTRLANICRPYGIWVYSGSGSVPISATRQAALRIIDSTQPTLLLLLADFDPAGITSIAGALQDDVLAFVRDLGGNPGRVAIRHLAVTAAMAAAQPEAVREPLNPPPGWPVDYKVELEAVPPDELDVVVEDALAMVRDAVAYAAAMAAEPYGRVHALEDLASRLRRNGAQTTDQGDPW